MAIDNRSPEPDPRPEPRGFDRPHRRSIFFPLLLLAAGVLLLLSNLNMIGPDVWGSIIRLWPLLIIVGALDGIYRGEGLAGQIFWLGLGVLFLLASLGYLAVNIWELLLRYWPVFLIALGIDILLGNRREAWARALAVILSLALLAGVVWFAGANFVAPGGAVQNSTISQPVSGATSASYDLAMDAGQFVLSGGAPSGELISGEVRSVRSGSVRESLTNQNGRAMYQLRQDSITFNIGTNNADHHWTLQINDEIPADLSATLGAGQLELQLSGIELTELDATVAAGQLEVDLPQEGDYSADLTTVVGETVIRIPSDAAVEIQVDGIFPISLNGEGLSQNGRIVTAEGSGPVVHIKVLNIIGSTRIERVR